MVEHAGLGFEELRRPAREVVDGRRLEEEVVVLVYALNDRMRVFFPASSFERLGSR
jgi:hypothetical protein